jgi:hypothetical protein
LTIFPGAFIVLAAEESDMEPELEMMNKQAVQIADLIYGALTKPRPTARDSRCFDLAGVLLAERGEERGWKVAELADSIQRTVNDYLDDQTLDAMESAVERGSREGA